MSSNIPKLIVSIHAIEENNDRLHLRINNDNIIVLKKNKIGVYQLDHDIQMKWKHPIFEFAYNNDLNSVQLVALLDNDIHLYNIDNHCVFVFSLIKNVLTIYTGSYYIT